MKGFEEISKMNLADLDRPNGQNPEQETEREESEAVQQAGDEQENPTEGTVTVEDLEGSEEAETVREAEPAENQEEKEEEIREPQGEHYYIDAKVTEKEMIGFLFGHNYRQPLMIIAMLVALAWPVMVIARQDENMLLAVVVAAIVLVALPLSTWNRGKRTVKTNPAYQQTFHYMLDEWGLHLKLGKEAIDVEWNKINKAMFLKSVFVLYTGKVNAFLVPTSGMGEQQEVIKAFVKRMKMR